MGIPFRDAEDFEALGAAAFLKVESVGGGAALRGALFLMNARGEPLEFAYNRLQLPETFLWRRADLRRHAERKLVASLLTICGRVPRLLLCRAEEVGSELFCQDIQVQLPVARIGRELQALPYAAMEVEEVLEQAVPEPQSLAESAEAAERIHLFWFPAPPAAESSERRLLERLSARGLLLEPFDRTRVGLVEVYGAEDT